jgi:hypothetical protein
MITRTPAQLSLRRGYSPFGKTSMENVMSMSKMRVVV